MPDRPHFKVETATSWNECVNELDVELMARQLKDVGAGYLFFTVMQVTKHLCAPNDTYNKITGFKPGEAASDRDLVNDLHGALEAYGIDLYLYYTGDGPCQDPIGGPAFGCVDPRKGVSRDFVVKWASVLREYCVRYGDKVKGWWIDGCYNKAFGYDEEKLKIYKDAIRDGNKNAIVAFNNGVQERVSYYSTHDDFLAGEMNDFVDIPESRFINGKQWHILAPLGVSPDGSGWHAWCRPGIKRTGVYMQKYVKKVNGKGGVVTIDVCLGRDGSIHEDQIEVLREIH
jgi:alpha-L-fucosidase